MTRHLVVIGAQRSGTTYLADLLAAHPDVALSEPRRPEPKVFLDDEVLTLGVQWYLDVWFADRRDRTLLVEKSTSYLDHPTAAARIEHVLGRPQLLAQLRDPVARAVSHWRFSSTHGVEDRPLEVALTESLTEELPWDRERFSVSPYAYLSRGDYASALAPWLDRFGPLLRVQFLADVTADPRTVLDLFSWLDLEPPEQLAVPPANESADQRSGLSVELYERLREHFASSDEALRELLGRSLPWDPPEEG